MMAPPAARVFNSAAQTRSGSPAGYLAPWTQRRRFGRSCGHILIHMVQGCQGAWRRLTLLRHRMDGHELGRATRIEGNLWTFVTGPGT